MKRSILIIAILAFLSVWGVVYVENMFKEAEASLKDNPLHSIEQIERIKVAGWIKLWKARALLIKCEANELIGQVRLEECNTDELVDYYSHRNYHDDNIKAYYYHALASFNGNKKEDALYYADKALKMSLHSDNSILRGKIEDLRDEILRSLSAEEKNDIIDSLIEKNHILEQKETNNNISLALLLIVLSISISVISWIAYRLKKTRDKEREAEILSLSEDLRRIETKIALESTSYDKSKLLLDRFLKEYFYTLDSPRKSDIIGKFEKIYLNIFNDTFFLDIEKDIDTRCHQLIHDFRRDFPGVSERDIRMICLLAIGMSTYTISFILKMSATNIYKTKYTISSKLDKSSWPRREELTEIMYSKKNKG